MTETIYADGQVRMRNPASGRPTVLPEDQAAIIKRSFSYLAEMVRTGGALPDEILRATYDGVRRYGRVVHGEQVTAEVMATSFTTGHITPRKTTMCFVFGGDKKLLAYIVEAPPRRLLHVLANPAEPVLTRRMLSGSVYWLEDGELTLEHTQRLTRYRLNPDLSGAFTFGSAEGAQPR